jgi:hypothetical protein
MQGQEFKMTTYYLHGTQRSNTGSKFESHIQTCSVVVRQVEEMSTADCDVDGMTVDEVMEFNRGNAGKFQAIAIFLGRRTMLCDTAEEARAMMEHILLADGWTTDKSLAERRTAKELELRKSGRLRMAGPNFKRAELEACRREIMEVV